MTPAISATGLSDDALQQIRIKEALQGLPIWARIRYASYLTGFSRTRLFELRALDAIKTKHVKSGQKGRGYILIHVPSLLRYIENMEG
jgi:hypothetical protein